MAVVVADRRAAHAAASAAYQLARELLASGVGQVQIMVQEVPTPWEAPLLKFYWGHVLGPISEQVRVEGLRYLPRVWHAHLKEALLGMEFVREGDRLVRRPCSTTRMSPAARWDYVQHAMAYAATELGVEFPLWPDDEVGAPLRLTPLHLAADGRTSRNQQESASLRPRPLQRLLPDAPQRRNVGGT